MNLRRIILRLIVVTGIVIAIMCCADILMSGNVEMSKHLIPYAVPACLLATIMDKLMGDIEHPERKR